LIGDHQQLRPQINNYELSRESSRGVQYALDVSLFERLVNPPANHRASCLPYTTLETQRRMHPSISQLIRNSLYPALKDSPTVFDYPEVDGMKHRLYWLNHEHLEAGANNQEHSTSHTNSFEVDMTVALVSHLVKQGNYRTGEQIAVLTPYLGQLQKLRAKLGSQFEIVVSDRDEDELVQQGLSQMNLLGTPPSVAGTVKSSLLKALRISTVDNFQGEESDVIVISLVRSNPQRKCGFLKTSNRINVLLSRARHGMYIIGNAATSELIPMWNTTIQTLKDANCFGPGFELVCPRHRDTPLVVYTADDFARLSPEGGCRLQCDKRLNCGHTCLRPCHSDVIHSAVQCLESCPRILKCGHSCTRECYMTCIKDCLEPIDMGYDFRLPCGHHVRTLPCWQAQNISLYHCPVEVERTVPGCNHTAKERCYVDVASLDYGCRKACGKLLPCGHTCIRSCRECVKKTATGVTTNHGDCVQPCNRNYTTCSHRCKTACHGTSPCDLCSSPCTNRCSHSMCAKKCSEPCAPCVEEKCASACEHSSCPLPCSAPCSHLPCSKRCAKLLGCGHQCPSICGELCPGFKFCQICAPEEMKQVVVDYITMEQYQDIDLDADPVIVPDCGHLLLKSTMDGVMAMADHYDVSADGALTGIKASSEPFSMSELKLCPSCRGSLRNIARYGRVVRRALLDEQTKKFMSWANNQFVPLAQKLQVEQDRIANTGQFETGAGSDYDDLYDDDQKGRREKLMSADCLPYLEQDLDLIGTTVDQMHKLRQCQAPCHKTLLRLQIGISNLQQSVRREEQPFQRVYELVQNLRNRGHSLSEFEFDSTVLQTGFVVRTQALRIRCELVILSDVLSIQKDAPLHRLCKIDFSENIKDCESLIKDAGVSQLPREQAEGHIFALQYYGLWRTISKDDTLNREELLSKARSHVDQARGLIRLNQGSTRGLSDELNNIELMLTGEFYQPVSSEERRQVYVAMATEFSGTG
jgi:AAA domain